MPTSLSWTLPAPPTGSTANGTVNPGAPALPCPIVPFTQAELLEIFDRIYPNHYLEPLRNPGPGYELLQAYAQLFARVSLAIEHVLCGGYILSSTGGAYATGEVEFTRALPHPEGLDVTIKRGTIVGASKSGRTYATTEDVEFLAVDLGPKTVAIQATAQGYEYNVPGQIVTADGTVLPGEIDTIVTLVEDPAVGDVTFVVAQPQATDGGVDPALDQNGADRGIVRLLNETDAAYRARVRSLPDNISPDAFSRAIEQVAVPLNASFQIIETWEIAYQTCWDAPADFIAGSNFNPTLFVFDDPTDPVPFRNRWMDTNEYRGCVIVSIENITPVHDTSMIYNEVPASPPDNDPADYQSERGERACCAFDVPSNLGFGYLQGCYDGFDAPKLALYKGLYETLQRIKAAGIAAVLELKGS